MCANESTLQVFTAGEQVLNDRGVLQYLGETGQVTIHTFTIMRSLGLYALKSKACAGAAAATVMGSAVKHRKLAPHQCGDTRMGRG